jgi:chemotaxis protein methyltransferase CheR
MSEHLTRILDYLKEKRGFDFCGYRDAMLARRVKHRFPYTKCNDFADYYCYLQDRPQELDHLIDALTINVSRFFRDTLTFEYLAERIIPFIIYDKIKKSDRYVRVWSAGCAMGEEPFSIAILAKEFLEKERMEMDVSIFATDVDRNILEKARKACYPFEAVANVKFRLIKKYFIPMGTGFQLERSIRGRVMFSSYDLLDRRSYAPPESVFGGFDLVLCRNVLIYFSTQWQHLILDKLYRSLLKGGFLVLGESESPPEDYQHRLVRRNDCCHIYRKR